MSITLLTVVTKALCAPTISMQVNIDNFFRWAPRPAKPGAWLQSPWTIKHCGHPSPFIISMPLLSQLPFCFRYLLANRLIVLFQRTTTMAETRVSVARSWQRFPGSSSSAHCPSLSSCVSRWDRRSISEEQRYSPLLLEYMVLTLSHLKISCTPKRDETLKSEGLGLVLEYRSGLLNLYISNSQ